MDGVKDKQRLLLYTKVNNNKSTLDNNNTMDGLTVCE